MRGVLCFLVTVLGMGGWQLAGAGSPQPDSGGEAEVRFRKLLETYVARLQPLHIERERADWAANISGSDADFARKNAAEQALIELRSDRAVFAELKQLKESGQVTDPILARQLDVMYRAFLPGQADPELQKRIVALESEVEQTFNTFRATVDGKTLTENDVREIIATTKDPAAAEAAWKAYMEVGRRVEPKLRELVKLRNEMARQLGFDNYQALRLKTQEIDPDELMKLFDELDALTAAPFAEFKAKLDARRAVWFGIGVAELRPWSYGDLFFQEAPPAEESGLDNLFKNADLVEIATRYFDGLGMQVADILARSSLYEQPGKTPHAFATDIDRAGDVRILLNLQPNAYWADTILHELGHAVYDVYIDSNLPFLLRTASHGITTEGVALMFGAMSKNEQWLKEFLGLEAAETARAGAAAREALQAEKLIFSRWAQVMVRFEQGMYADPEQDLGKLWWDLKRKYQLLNPPADTGRPDYAAKAHIVTTPIYYHNYLMGELFAAQIRAQIAKDVLRGADPVRASFINQPAVGAWLRERVFAPGNLYSWNELTRRATGAPLSATFFAQEYVR